MYYQGFIIKWISGTGDAVDKKCDSLASEADFFEQTQQDCIKVQKIMEGMKSELSACFFKSKTV